MLSFNVHIGKINELYLFHCGVEPDYSFVCYLKDLLLLDILWSLNKIIGKLPSQMRLSFCKLVTYRITSRLMIKLSRLIVVCILVGPVQRRILHKQFILLSL